MHTFYRINLIFTIIVTVLSLLFYGLLLAIPLGAFQVIFFLAILASKRIPKEDLKIHLAMYGLFALGDLLFFFLTLDSNPDLFFVGPVFGMLLAWYHVWISHRVAKLVP